MRQPIEIELEISEILKQYNLEIMASDDNIEDKIRLLDRLSNKLKHFADIVSLSIKDLAS